MGEPINHLENQSFFEGRTMPEPWVSVDEVANPLDVANDSVYRWIETKGLPALRVAWLWKFQLSGIDDWVQVGGANDEPQNNGE
jgi:excisionase family DNA binding protein